MATAKDKKQNKIRGTIDKKVCGAKQLNIPKRVHCDAGNSRFHILTTVQCPQKAKQTPNNKLNAYNKTPEFVDLTAKESCHFSCTSIRTNHPI